MMSKLPAPAKDGKHYLDVRVGGKWDGIVVVDADGVYIGVYIRRHIEEFALPFAPSAIEDIRSACLFNRALAALPFDLGCGAVLAILIFSPVTLALAASVSPLFAVCSILACMTAIYIMYLDPGYPFARFPVALLGLCQILAGIVLLLHTLLENWFSVS